MNYKLTPIAEQLKACMPNQAALTLDQLAETAHCSKGFLYEEIKAGKLKLNKLGTKSIVLVPEALNWLTGGAAYVVQPE